MIMNVMVQETIGYLSPFKGYAFQQNVLTYDDAELLTVCCKLDVQQIWGFCFTSKTSHTSLVQP